MAHQKAEALLTGCTPIRIRDIEPSALDAFAATWANNPGRSVAWPWPDMAADFRRKFPERFEAAIWSGDILCGLSIGKPSHSQEIVTIRFIEGNPAPHHPLKGTIHIASIEVGLAYGLAIGATLLRIDDPHPETLRLYTGLGFRLETPRGRSAYCEKEI